MGLLAERTGASPGLKRAFHDAFDEHDRILYHAPWRRHPARSKIEPEEAGEHYAELRSLWADVETLAKKAGIPVAHGDLSDADRLLGAAKSFFTKEDPVRGYFQMDMALNSVHTALKKIGRETGDLREWSMASPLKKPWSAAFDLHDKILHHAHWRIGEPRDNSQADDDYAEMADLFMQVSKIAKRLPKLTLKDMEKRTVRFEPDDPEAELRRLGVDRERCQYVVKSAESNLRLARKAFDSEGEFKAGYALLDLALNELHIGLKIVRRLVAPEVQRESRLRALVRALAEVAIDLPPSRQHTNQRVEARTMGLKALAEALRRELGEAAGKNPYVSKTIGNDFAIWFKANGKAYTWTGSGLKPSERASKQEYFASEHDAERAIQQVVIPHIEKYKADLERYIQR